MDENKLWEISKILERTVTEQAHVTRMLERLHKRVDAIHEHDDQQETRMALAQENIANLCEAVAQMRTASKHLSRIAFGFLTLLGILAALVGALGWDILPTALKAGVSTLF